MTIKEWIKLNNIGMTELATRLNITRQGLWFLMQGSGIKLLRRHGETIKKYYPKTKGIDELSRYKSEKRERKDKLVEKVWFNESEKRLLNKYYWVISEKLLDKINNNKFVSINIYNRTIKNLHEEIEMCEKVINNE